MKNDLILGLRMTVYQWSYLYAFISIGQIPLHPLNLTLLSNETGLSRELVEGSIREVLQALSQSVAAKKSIEFDLKDIGR